MIALTQRSNALITLDEITMNWTAICDEVSKTLNQRLTVYRLRAWLLDVVCDILIVALSLMSVSIGLVNNYAVRCFSTNVLFSL